jgi:HK97 family phage portal protein
MVTRRAGRILTATDYGRDVLINSPSGWEVEQPWLWWVDADDTPPTDYGFGNPIPGAERRPWVGALPAVARCRSLIADTLAGMPWQVYRGRERLATPDWIFDPQALRHDMRVTPTVQDVRLSAVEFWSAMIVSALDLGEGVVYVPARDATGAPLPPLFLLNPSDLDVHDGAYWVQDVRLGPDEIIVVRNRVWPGKYRGIGVLDQFAADLGLGEKLRSYAASMLGRGIPSGYLKVTAPDLSQDEADKLRARWMRAHGGSMRKIAVLNATTEFHPLQLDPQALQLVELMRLSAWEICLLYGVPPYRLGISMGYNNTYANIESAGIDFVADCLMKWARRIESAFDAMLPRGTSMKINLDQLRRADTKTRYESYQVGIAGGWLTIDEVRELEDLPPMNAAPQLRQANDNVWKYIEASDERNNGAAAPAARGS